MTEGCEKAEVEVLLREEKGRILLPKEDNALLREKHFGDSKGTLSRIEALYLLERRSFRLVQNGIGDVPLERDADPTTDVRSFTAAYYDLEYDPSKVKVYTEEGKRIRREMIADAEEEVLPSALQRSYALKDGARKSVTLAVTRTTRFWTTEDAPETPE